MKFVIYLLFIFTITAFSFKKTADSLSIQTVNNSTVFIGDSIINSMQNTYTFYSKDKIQNSIIDTLKKWGFDDEVGIQLVRLSFPFLEDSTVIVDETKLHHLTIITSKKNKGRYIKEVFKLSGNAKKIPASLMKKENGLLMTLLYSNSEKEVSDETTYYIPHDIEVVYGGKLHSVPMLTHLKRMEGNLVIALEQQIKEQNNKWVTLNEAIIKVGTLNSYTFGDLRKTKQDDRD